MQPFSLLSIGAVFALAFSFCAPGMAQADEDYTDLSLTYEKSNQRYVVDANGSFILDVELVARINEDRAIDSNAQRPISFNQSLETLDIVEAFTQKPDGRKVIVGPEQIREQQEQASSRAPMFQDTRVKVVIFPEVEVGDRLVLHYKRKRKTALFPQQFEDTFLPDFYQVEQMSLTYDLPADKPLYAANRGFKAVTPAAAAGRKVYRWDYVPGKKHRVEVGSVSYADYGDFVAVSTFANFKEFAQAYEARAAVEVTPVISALAKEITANLQTPRSKALALGDWVRKNIRYVAVYVGPGGVVPHQAQAVLDNRYGDCKDHVALLEALLRAVTIESSPALINLGNSYVLPQVPALGVLNHVITYVPELDLYIDSTATPIAAGYLPIPELGKPVILTKTGEPAYTHALQPSHGNTEQSFKIHASGASDFSHVSTVDGWGAEFNRYVFRSIAPKDRDQLVQNVLQMVGQTGSGTFSSDALTGNASSFKTELKGRADNLVTLPGPSGVPTFTSLAGGILQNTLSFASEKERTQSFTCLSSEAEEQARFEFPKGVSIVALPRALSLQKAGFDYSSTYRQQGNVVLITRRAKFSHSKTVCSPQDFEEMKPVLEQMLNDLKSQIIVHS